MTWLCGTSLVTWIFRIYCATTLVGLLLLYRYILRSYRTYWYDISSSGYLGKLEWSLVEKLLTDDPLVHKPHCRSTTKLKGITDIVNLLFLLSLWVPVGYWIFYGNGALLQMHASEDQMRVPVFLFGFCTVGATLIGVFFQLRLKARSENRQSWINEIREVLASLIADLPMPDGSGDAETKKIIQYFPRHAKLELLLNPSEKVHRTLMALIRHAYGFDDVSIDEGVRHNLKPDVFKTAFDNDKEKKIHFEELKSQIIRLSNVILKREWEQVKHAR